MFAHLPEVEAQVAALIDAQHYEAAIGHMVVSVHNHHRAPGIAHHHLYYPGLDRQIERLAALLEAASPATRAPAAPTDNTLIVATQLYQLGGHSRVVEDFARELGNATVVLTDTFLNYRNDPVYRNWVHEAFGDTPVIVLPQGAMWARCRALLSLTRRLNPHTIFHFNHHQDPIGFIGTLPHRGARQALVHHTDHNPALGVTLPGFAHADFTDEIAQTCRRELHIEPTVLPLYVPDLGRKQFTPSDTLSVVTSGTQVKFTRSGELALHHIAATVLRSVGGRFIHIGPMEDDWAQQIRTHLAQHDIDPGRFVAMGTVPSLWQTLASLDAHVYMGSAPVAGARAAIEAQGCGYPVAYYREADETSLVAMNSFYADQGIAWTTLADLSALLKAMPAHHAQLSDKARAFYDSRYSRGEFLRVLATLGGH